MLIRSFNYAAMAIRDMLETQTEDSPCLFIALKRQLRQDASTDALWAMPALTRFVPDSKVDTINVESGLTGAFTLASYAKDVADATTDINSPYYNLKNCNLASPVDITNAINAMRLTNLFSDVCRQLHLTITDTHTHITPRRRSKMQEILTDLENNTPMTQLDNGPTQLTLF